MVLAIELLMYILLNKLHIDFAHARPTMLSISLYSRFMPAWVYDWGERERAPTWYMVESTHYIYAFVRRLAL